MEGWWYKYSCMGISMHVNVGIDVWEYIKYINKSIDIYACKYACKYIVTRCWTERCVVYIHMHWDWTMICTLISPYKGGELNKVGSRAKGPLNATKTCAYGT